MVTRQQLQAVIGEEQYATLNELYAGWQHYFSKKQDMPFKDLKTRNQRIKNDYYGGMSNKDLQKKYKLGRSQISAIVNAKQDAK